MIRRQNSLGPCGKLRKYYYLGKYMRLGDPSKSALMCKSRVVCSIFPFQFYNARVWESGSYNFTLYIDTDLLEGDCCIMDLGYG